MIGKKMTKIRLDKPSLLFLSNKFMNKPPGSGILNSASYFYSSVRHHNYKQNNYSHYNNKSQAAIHIIFAFLLIIYHKIK
jgi:hypothetical protein